MDLKLRIKWLLVFRSCFLVVAAASGGILEIFYQEPFSQDLYIFLIAGLLFSVISGVIWLPIKSSRALTIFAYLEVSWDLLTTTILVSKTGGIQSPCLLLYGVHILMAAVVLMSEGSLSAAIGSSIFLVVSQLFFQTTDINLLEVQYVSRLVAVCSFLLLLGAGVAWLFKNRRDLARSLEKTTAEFQELSRVHSTILDHISTGIMYVSAHYSVVWMNKAGERIIGSSWGDKNIKSTDLECFLQENGRYESRLKVADGEEKIIGHHIAPIPDGGFVVVFQDVTEVRVLEGRLQLQDKLAAVGQLAAGIAHEIRTPLASISGSIQLIHSEMVANPPVEKLMRIVLRETDRLDDLTRDFLNYAKPSRIELQAVNLHSAVEDLRALVANLERFKKFGMKIEEAFEPDLLCYCDIRSLKQILWNLVKNAVEASREGGVIRLCAEKRQRLESEFILISVEDKGEGMSQEVKEKVFEPFFSTKGSGSGLGLALVYEMIKAHDGTIGVESVLGKGSRIWFELPSRNKDRERRTEAA